MQLVHDIATIAGLMIILMGSTCMVFEKIMLLKCYFGAMSLS